MNVEDPLHEYGRWCKPVLEDGETMKQYENALEVMDLLNEQNDEIGMLKSKLEDCEFAHRTEMAHHRVIEKDLKKENEQLKKDVDYWKQVASQYSNELNAFEHCKKYKTECKDIHWSSD